MMIEFFTADPNLPFAIALALMLAIAIIEGVGLLFGIDASGPFDALLPDIDLDANVASTPLSNTLGWLHIGKIPFLMLLVIFLAAFGSIGLCIQSISQNISDSMLSPSIASIPALISSLLVVRFLGGGLGKILKEESSAVSQESFIGKIATITLGTAESGQPAQAKLQDEHGQTHYVMVEPCVEEEAYQTGETVVLVERKDSFFLVTKFQ